jgi:transposase
MSDGLPAKFRKNAQNPSPWKARTMKPDLFTDGQIVGLEGQVRGLEHFPKKVSRRGFSRWANADSIFATESGGWDGQAEQYGFARAGSFGDRRRVSTRQAAKQFAIGIATAGTWARLKRVTGEVRPAKQGKPKGSVLDGHADFILGALAEVPDMTLDEMVERLREERGVMVVRTAVWKFLDRRGLTHKKRLPTPASKSALT